MERIKAVVSKEEVGAIVIGKSLDYRQKENPIMKDIRALKKRIEKEFMVRVYLEPEFLTSAQARRARGRHGLLDASAAAIILQSHLDRTANQEP